MAALRQNSMLNIGCSSSIPLFKQNILLPKVCSSISIQTNQHAVYSILLLFFYSDKTVYIKIALLLSIC